MGGKIKSCRAGRSVFHLLYGEFVLSYGEEMSGEETMEKGTFTREKFFLLLLQLFTACLLVPSLLLLWTVLASGDPLELSYFSRRILSSRLFLLPETLFRAGVFCAVFCTVYSIVAGALAKERSEKMRFAAYAGTVLLMILIFLRLKIPFGIGVTVPLLLLGSVSLYTSGRKDPRKKLFPGKRALAGLSQRFAAGIFLGLIVFISLFLFQEGTDYVLLRKGGVCLLLLPMAGCLLPSGKSLRDYLVSTGTGFVFLGAVFAFIAAFADTLWIMDIAIVFTFLFLEYQALLLLRGILPELRNLSLIFLVLLLFVNGKILPGVCDTNIVTLSVFVLYILGDNAERMLKILRRRLDPERDKLFKPLRKDLALQGWCLSSFVLVCLGGAGSVLPLLFLMTLLFCTGILKLLLKKESGFGRALASLEEDLPLLPEKCLIVLFAVLQVLLGEKNFLASVIAAGCCFSCIRNLGFVITGSGTGKRSVHASLYHAAASGGIFLFMLLLFFYGVSSSVAASMGLLLESCALLGEGAYLRSACGGNQGRLLRIWVSGVIASLGFAVAALPSVPLPMPSWELSAVACGALAFFALNVYAILEDKLKKKEAQYGES